MINIEEYSKKMKSAQLFQGMGFNRILEFNDNIVRFEFLVERRHCHSGILHRADMLQVGLILLWRI